MTESKNLGKPWWENYWFLWLLISFSGRTKQIFFLVIKLEPGLLSWLQPRINNCVPTELDVSISAFGLRSNTGKTQSVKYNWHSDVNAICPYGDVDCFYFLNLAKQINMTWNEMKSNRIFKIIHGRIRPNLFSVKPLYILSWL